MSFILNSFFFLHTYNMRYVFHGIKIFNGRCLLVSSPFRMSIYQRCHTLRFNLIVIISEVVMFVVS